MMRTLLLLLALAQTQDTQAGDFVFRMPAGWVRHDRNDTTVLVSPNNTGRAVTYIMLAATPVGASADVRVAFQGAWAHVIQGSRVAQGGRVAAKHFDGGFDGVYTSASLVDRSGQRIDVATVGTVYGARFETVTYLTTDFRNDVYSAGQRTLSDFVKTLRFGATQAGGALQHDAAGFYTNLTLPRGTGKFDGVYRAVGQVDLTPVGPGGVHHIGAKYMTFFPDGRVKEGIPDRGMDGLDEDEEIRLHVTGWGTYAMDGENGKITFARASIYDQTTITWDIHEYPDRLEIHGDTYKKMESGDGVKLSGTFRRADYQTLSAGARQGITFTADGRFTDEGIFKAAFVQYRTSKGYEFDNGAPGTGTYRIKHYSLELTYDNGLSKRAVFCIDPGKAGGDVSSFWFSEYLFARVP
jgi:hypothetical protein